MQNLSLYGYGALFNLFAIFAQNIYLDGMATYLRVYILEVILTFGQRK